jgi:hypothetical protein
MFEVRWIQSALDELMERWMEADSRLRAAITTSVNVIDVRLARNPLTEGKARSEFALSTPWGFCSKSTPQPRVFMSSTFGSCRSVGSNRWRY